MDPGLPAERPAVVDKRINLGPDGSFSAGIESLGVVLDLPSWAADAQ